MTMPRTEIVPFGKYRGQPVEVLKQDRDYCDWLAGQDWFRSQYTAIHTLIVNNFGAPEETPEHNALQARFTDKAWHERFVVAMLGGPCGMKEFFDEQRRRYVEGYSNPSKNTYPLTDAQIEEILAAPPIVEVSDLGFEVKGADVQFRFCFDALQEERWRMRVECKPVLGDDYPAVLRQMQSNTCNLLLVGTDGYTGTGATLEQVRLMFRSAQISIVFLSDV